MARHWRSHPSTTGYDEAGMSLEPRSRISGVTIMIRWFLSTAVAVGLSFPVVAHAQDAQSGLPLPDGAATASAIITGTVTDADSRAGTTGALPGYSRSTK